MPNEQFTLLEATPQTIANLNRLKSIPPNLNLGATEMSNGNNSGIVANPPSAGNAVITGPFDVQLTYLEEDDGQGNMEIVPYVQVFDSSLQNATYAGYVYHQNQILNVMQGVLAPSQGWLYLDIDLITNTYTYDIGAYVPTYPLGTKRWCYALAYITVSNNVYSIRRIHVPGNIVMPTFDDEYQGYFKLSSHVVAVGGEFPKCYIDCNGGYCWVNGIPRRVEGTSLELTNEAGATYSIVLHYQQTLNTRGEIAEYTFTFERRSRLSQSYQSLVMTDLDSYCIIGEYSEHNGNIYSIMQLTYGIPHLFTFSAGC